MPDDANRLPPLKTDPKFGYYPWWPEDGDAWVHPEDVARARRLIPSPRVWRRDGRFPEATPTDADGGYVVMNYGAESIRVRRTLWKELPPLAFEIGDWVEVRPRGMTNEPQTGQVRDTHWDEHAAAVRYYLSLADGTPLEKPFGAEDLKPVEPRNDQPEAYHQPAEDLGEDLGIMES